MTALLLKSFGSLRERTSLAMSSGPPLHQRALEKPAEPSQCTYPETWWGKALTCSWYSLRVRPTTNKSFFNIYLWHKFENIALYLQERRWMRFACYHAITKTWFLWDQRTAGWLWWISQLPSCSLETKDITGKRTGVHTSFYTRLVFSVYISYVNTVWQTPGKDAITSVFS